MKRALAVVLFLFVACTTAPKIPANRYGLHVVPDVATYQRLAKAEPDKRLVNLQSFIPGIVLDIRYATTNNFMRQKLYPVAKAYLRYPAAVALREVQAELAKDHLGLKIFDAYRPYSITEKMWEPVKDADFVADPAKGSRHNRGAAVDVTLIDLTTGKEVEMPSEYDEFTDRARRNYTAASSLATTDRNFLQDVMTRHGFIPLPSEWWHFDYKTWQSFDLMDVPLTSLP